MNYNNNKIFFHYKLTLMTEEPRRGRNLEKSENDDNHNNKKSIMKNASHYQYYLFINSHFFINSTVIINILLLFSSLLSFSESP